MSFVAAAAGTYRITISPLRTDDETTGRYEIKVIELRKATDEESRQTESREAKAKGIALLAEIETTIAEIKSPLNRIQAQLKAAELLGSQRKARRQVHGRRDCRHKRIYGKRRSWQRTVPHAVSLLGNYGMK